VSDKNRDDMYLFGALFTDLIVGFLAGACIWRTIWRVVVWFTLPIVVAILAVLPAALDFDSGEEQGWAEFVAFILMLGGFVATGAGLALGALLRALIKRNLPKEQSGTNRQDAVDASTDAKD
jgi:hypothetical protein